MRKYLLSVISMALLACGIIGYAARTSPRQSAGDAPDGRQLDSIAALGYRLFAGDSVLKADPRRAAELIRYAAEHGHPQAANNLGFILLYGDSAMRNPAEAMRWFAVAADAGLPTALSMLGDFYRDGLATAPDTLRADSLYECAARRGLADARLKLVDINRSRWPALSADSLLHLGQRYYTSGLHDVAAAVLSLATRDVDILPYDVAADSVHPGATALAVLGEAYAQGLGVRYDYLLSLSMFLEAARHGDPSAQFVIAETLQMSPEVLSPLGVSNSNLESDPDFWYRMAARKPAEIRDARQAFRRLLPR